MANKEDKKDVDRILGSDSTSAGAKEPKATGLEASAGGTSSTLAETKTSSKRNLSPSFGEGSTPKKASVMVDHCNWAYGYFVPLEPKREVRFKPMSLKLVPEEKLEKGDVLDDEEIPYWRRMEPFQLNRASLGNFGKDKQFYRIFAKASKDTSMAKMLVDCDALTKKFRDMSTDESATVMYKEKDIYRFMARTISSRVSFTSPMYDAEMPGHFRTPLEFESTPFPTVGLISCPCDHKQRMLDETHYEYFIAMPTYDHFKRLVVVGLVDISGIDICHKNLAGSGPLTWKQRTSELDIPYLGIKAMPFCKVLRGSQYEDVVEASRNLSRFLMRRIIQSDLFDEEYSIIHAYKYMVQRFPSVMMDPREYGSFTGSGRGVLRRVIAEEAYQSKEVDDELESRKEIDCGWGDEAESHFQLNVDESDSAPASPHSDWEDMQREESDDNDSEMGYSQTPVQASKQLEQQSKIMHDLEYVEKFMNTNVPLLHSGASLIRDLKTTDPDIKKQAKTLRAVTKYLKRLNIQIVTAENL